MDSSNGKEGGHLEGFKYHEAGKRQKKTGIFCPYCGILFSLSILYSNIFPGNFGVGIVSQDRPVTLYFDYLEQSFQPDNFSNVVSFATSHGFNTLMMVVYINHKQYSMTPFSRIFTLRRNLKT